MGSTGFGTGPSFYIWEVELVLWLWVVSEELGTTGGENWDHGMLEYDGV